MSSNNSVLQVTAAMQVHGTVMVQALVDEMAKLAQVTADKMRERSPKWRSNLVNSIKVTKPDEFVWEVRPGVAHGLYRELGQKPGKGLPRFFDPQAKPLVDWLQSQAFGGVKRVRKGTARFTARELELRDRYNALSWFVKRKGLKAQPFVQPTHDEMSVLVPQRMAAVVARLTADGGSTA